MHRLDIRKDGEVVKGVLLEAGEYTIGRDSQSDIHLIDSSISRNHARLVQISNNFYIEDMGSTNGTRYNDIKVTKHLLRDEDLIQIGGFDLLYTSCQVREKITDDTDPDEMIDVQTPADTTGHKNNKKGLSALNLSVVTLRFFRGPYKGLLKTISRSFYTIGQPGDEIAAIARRPQGFFLLNIGGGYPKINDQEINTSASVQLNDGDILEVGDHLLELYLDG